jgi:hypothetical protein
VNRQEFYLFKDWQSLIPDQLGKTDWITLYEYTATSGPDQDIARFSALLPESKMHDPLDSADWDLLYGSGMPGHIFGPGDQVAYERFGDDDGIEPIVFDRSFHGIKPSYLELAEEFRHYFNLYENKQTGSYISVDDDGEEIEAARISNEKVEVRLRYLKRFLAVKGMKLALYFEIDRKSKLSPEELGIKAGDEAHNAENYVYELIVINRQKLIGDRGTLVRLRGKKIVAGEEGWSPRLTRELREYESFIIDVDENGREVLHTSNEEELSNYFGKNSGAPHYLTPVFFRREVLTKYYANPQKYSIEDGYLSCAGLWGLRMDNNHDRYVVVFLGDLGKLSIREQRYWRSFNVAPEGSISEVAFRRGFLAEFADPSAPDLVFKSSLRQFQETWSARFGWPLFKELRPEDVGHLTSLKVPTSEEQHQFDQEVLSLCKILVDSLNEEEIGRGLVLPPNAKGITKLRVFLEQRDREASGQVIPFLRNLQSLRSGVAHRKGDDYWRAIEYFSIGTSGFIQGFRFILQQATVMLSVLVQLADASANSVSKTE